MTNLSITYLGHATTLIALQEQPFLANPYFSRSRLFSKKGEPVTAPNFPDPKAVLVTDARYAHLDLFSYKFISTRVPLIAPKGIGPLLSRFFSNPVVEIPIWSFHREGDVEIHALPVQYRGYRIFRYRSAAAFVLKSPTVTVYYAAGTGPTDQFQEAASLFDIDIAILPVGPHRANFWEKAVVLNPEQVVDAFQKLRAKHLIPIGWKDNTREELERLSKEKNLGDRIHFLNPGQTLSL